MRIKLARHGQADLLTWLVELPLAMIGQVSYEYELDLNGSSSDSIDSGREEAVYRVTVTGSGTLTVYSTGNIDAYGHFLDSFGNQLAYNDNYNTLNFRLGRSVSTGVYYLQVRHYSSDGTGDYIIYSNFTAFDFSSRSKSRSRSS